MKIIFTLDEAVEALREKYRLAQGGASIVIARPRPLQKSKEPHWLDVLARELREVPPIILENDEVFPNKIGQIKVLRSHTNLGLAEAKMLIEERFETLSRVGNRRTDFGFVTLTQRKQG